MPRGNRDSNFKEDIMSEEKIEPMPEEDVEIIIPNQTGASPDPAPVADERIERRPQRDRKDRGRGGRRGGPRRDDRRSEFAQKLIGIRRVARVMAGGRRFNFSAALVLGDKKGRVGVGLGKAADTALAIEKATRHAKRGMLTLDLTKTQSIPHDVRSKYCASIVEIRPSPGRGLVAGSSVRSVLEIAGIRDVTAKLLSRSKNPINNARAAIEALRQIAK